ncbi:MAG: diguanylate cyclase [Chloroflexi bacterium]|nr:diguanylate cyclase [Chloroflexota bacterium]
MAGEITGHRFSAAAPGLPRITASLGTASYPADGTSPAELVAQADRDLYAAKANKGAV